MRRGAHWGFATIRARESRGYIKNADNADKDVLVSTGWGKETVCKA